MMVMLSISVFFRSHDLGDMYARHSLFFNMMLCQSVLVCLGVNYFSDVMVACSHLLIKDMIALATM